MQIDIVVYVQCCPRTRRRLFVPPSIGIRLAALTPVCHQVRVIHPPVERFPLTTKANLICVLFASPFAELAYHLAVTLAAKGKVVIMGGPHVTHWPDKALKFCEAVLVGAIEPIWPWLLADASVGQLRSVYKEENAFYAWRIGKSVLVSGES